MSQVQPIPESCFTVTASELKNILTTEVKVFEKPTVDFKNGKNFQAIWDTGATRSAITERVAKALNLSPIGITETHTAHGLRRCNLYLVSIFLPNKIGFANVSVTEVLLTGFDLLIGMDIIGAGDFAITNKNNQTVFTYRTPSFEHIDFVKEFDARSVVGRNDPCPCGSKKKYKKCHGA